ncbi:MAG: 16S rRNA (adenine(1518)-N(6)/adenine(1519)-N(6))-dimethyltransferase RsmA [Bacteroidota bacterium]
MLQPKKSLGQNFLRDQNTARKIVDALQAPHDAHVVEIGPGTGSLTRYLLPRFERLTVVEIDQRAVGVLSETFPGLDVRHGDVLDIDWKGLASEKGGPIHAIGNLPYYITSQILFSILEARRHVREAVMMMQLEVAERLVAAPRTKAYGILSVVAQLYADVELLFRVPPTVFVPRPDVTSAVIRLVPRMEDAHPDLDDDTVRRVIRTAFNQRRKTLRNSLKPLATEFGTSVPDTWSGKRAEELTPDEFVDLARRLTEGTDY